MSHGPLSVFTQTLSVNATVSPTFDLKRAWPSVYLVIPTMSAAVITATCNIYIQGSADGTNFGQVCFPPVNSSTTGLVTFTIANSISQSVIPIPNNLRYMRVQLGNTATAAVAFSVICAGD